ncbi:MAG: hypothetical protein WC401_05345 [Bacteroidales bacterium]
MTDKNFNKMVDFYNAGGGLLPVNQKAHEIIEQSDKSEVISFIEVTQRDLKFHRAYFALLKFIYGYMPMKFKKAVPESHFYLFLKHLKKQYKVLFTFKDGTTMVEYDSIAFGRMSQKTFESYIREQLPFIYTEVIGAYFEGEMYDNIIESIEDEFKKFLAKL